MTNLTNFEFNGNQVRVILIDNVPWFVAKDICEVLGIKNNREALSRLKDYEKGVSNTDTPGGKQDVAIFSESGLYRLILTSRKPQAEPFQDWVCQEVLPSIRKTGKYEVNPTPVVKSVYDGSVFLQRLKEKKNHVISNHLWAPFFEAHLAYEYLEDKLHIKFNKYDLVDGSIGKRWVKFREDKPWKLLKESYIHVFMDGRPSVPCAAYQLPELEHFKNYIEQIYIPSEMPIYLVEKFGKLAAKELYELNEIQNKTIKSLTAGKVTPKQEKLYKQWKMQQNGTLELPFLE